MSTIATKYGYDKLGNRNMVIDPKENVTYFNYDLQGRLRSTISPDGNTAYYEYNKVGSLTSKKDENGNVINFTYDNLYRLIRKDYPDSTHAYFTYDAVGRRLHTQDANTLTYFDYDAGGRLTSTHDCILDKWISYTYDKLGRRDSMTDPEGDVIYYDYDSVKLIRIKRNTDEEAEFDYDAGGRRNYTLLGNGSYTYYDYDVNGRLTRVANHKSDESVISSFEYTLDPVGNRIAMELASGDTVYYEYDGIYQLVEEDRRQSDDSFVYTNYFEYDLAGNRTHLHFVDSGTDDWTYYTYNIENQLTIEETGGTATYYTYDAAGALLRKDVGGTISYYEYNYDGLMNRFDDGNTVATYTFDTDSRRIEKDVDGTVSKFAYSGADVVAEYDGDDVLQATFNTPSTDRNLTQKRGGNIYHYLQDGLGSVRNILDANEAIQNTYDYTAFGAVYGTPTENVSNPFRFTSRRWDSESSLNFYRMRMYNQKISRFLSKDAVFDTNLYVYVKNNPVNQLDPLGQEMISVLTGWHLITAGRPWSAVYGSKLEKASLIVPTEIPMCLMYRESGKGEYFDAGAQNGSMKGLFQISPSTADDIQTRVWGKILKLDPDKFNSLKEGEKLRNNLFKAYVNVFAGVLYLWERVWHFDYDIKEGVRRMGDQSEVGAQKVIDCADCLRCTCKYLSPTPDNRDPFLLDPIFDDCYNAKKDEIEKCLLNAQGM